MSEINYINQIRDNNAGKLYDVQDSRIPAIENSKYLHTSATGEMEWVSIDFTTDYNDLLNKPIINQDLDAVGFSPVAGTYYKHTGQTDTYTAGIIYLYDGETFKAIDGSGSGSGLNIVEVEGDAQDLEEDYMEIELTQEQYESVMENKENTIIDLYVMVDDHGGTMRYDIYLKPTMVVTATDDSYNFIIVQGYLEEKELLGELTIDHDQYLLMLEKRSIKAWDLAPDSSTGKVLSVDNKHDLAWVNMPEGAPIVNFGGYIEMGQEEMSFESHLTLTVLEFDKGYNSDFAVAKIIFRSPNGASYIEQPIYLTKYMSAPEGVGEVDGMLNFSGSFVAGESGLLAFELDAMKDNNACEIHFFSTVLTNDQPEPPEGVTVIEFGGYADQDDFTSHLTLTMDEFMKGIDNEVAFAKVPLSDDDGATIAMYVYLPKMVGTYVENQYGILSFSSTNKIDDNVVGVFQLQAAWEQHGGLPGWDIDGELIEINTASTASVEMVTITTAQMPSAQTNISIDEETYNAITSDNKNVIIRLVDTQSDSSIDFYRAMRLVYSGLLDQTVYYSQGIRNGGDRMAERYSLTPMEDNGSYYVTFVKMPETINAVDINSEVISGASSSPASAGTVLTADGSGNAAWTAIPAVDYDDLENQPIINQKYGMDAFTVNQTINLGDTIAVDTSSAAATRLQTLLESLTYDPQSMAAILLETTRSDGSTSGVLRIVAMHANDRYIVAVNGPVGMGGMAIIYNSLTGFDPVAADGIKLEESGESYYFTVLTINEGSSWNGSIMGKQNSTISPAPVKGQFYKRDRSIYFYNSSSQYKKVLTEDDPISYNDLTDKPTIVTNYNDLTHQPVINQSYQLEAFTLGQTLNQGDVIYFKNEPEQMLEFIKGLQEWDYYHTEYTFFSASSSDPNQGGFAFYVQYRPAFDSFWVKLIDNGRDQIFYDSQSEYGFISPDVRWDGEISYTIRTTSPSYYYTVDAITDADKWNGVLIGEETSTLVPENRVGCIYKRKGELYRVTNPQFSNKLLDSGDVYLIATNSNSSTTEANTSNPYLNLDVNNNVVNSTQLIGSGATSVASYATSNGMTITFSSTDTTYTAGDGLDLSGTTFSEVSTYERPLIDQVFKIDTSVQPTTKTQIGLSSWTAKREGNIVIVTGSAQLTISGIGTMIGLNNIFATITEEEFQFNDDNINSGYFPTDRDDDTRYPVGTFYSVSGAEQGIVFATPKDDGTNKTTELSLVLLKSTYALDSDFYFTATWSVK